jgi:integrase
MLKYAREGVTVYPYLDPSHPTKEGKHSVKICVVHQRKPRYYKTGIYLTKEEFEGLDSTKKRELIQLRNAIQNQHAKYKHHVEQLLNQDNFSFSTLATLMGGSSSEKTVTEAFSVKVAELNSNKQVGTAKHYQDTINSLTSFVGGCVIAYKDVTPLWLSKYEKYMVERGRSLTTISMYLRTLRAIFNEAILAGYVERSLYPFGLVRMGKYEIPSSVGRKLALTLAQVGQLFDYDDGSEVTQRYLDLWRFSYLCNGANFNDILRLKYSNIEGEEIFFLRGKTSRTSKKKKEIAAYITPEMQQIIERWGNKKTSKDTYIFPYLNGITDVEKQREVVLDVIKRTNKRTLRISKELGLPKVTTYTARHSFATVLKRSGANIAYISESLGHSDLKTTENYLAAFESEERKKNADALLAFKKENIIAT